MNRTDIDYADYSWNPLAMRCTPVSEGCANCWTFPLCKRHAANPTLSKAHREAKAGGPPMLREDELDAPLRLRKPARIVVQFMGDLFHEDVPMKHILNVMVIAGTSGWHNFLFLTKRPKRMGEAIDLLDKSGRLGPNSDRKNVWLGVTVENDKHYDRIEQLLKIPAAVRWVSYEPLLSALDLTPWFNRDTMPLERRANNESPRTSVSGADGFGVLHRGRHGPNMAARTLCGRKSHGQPVIHEERIENPSRDDAIPRIPTHNVYRGPKRAYGNLRTPGCLDGRQPCGNTGRNGDQPQGRQPPEQHASELGGCHAAGKHTARRQGLEADGETRPNGNKEYERKADTRTGVRDSSALRSTGHGTNTHRTNIRGGAEYDSKYLSPANLEASPIGFVVVGCESGPRRRPCKLQWVVDVVQQCAAARVPVFVKQIPVPKHPNAIDLRNSLTLWDDACNFYGWRVSHDMSEWPERLRVRQCMEQA